MRISRRHRRGEPGAAEAKRADERGLGIARYDDLSEKQIIPRLPELSQLELAAIDTHERSNQARPGVLSKVHWLTAREPLPGYDALGTEEVVQALSAADTAELKAVRDYERHHRDRHMVRAEIARLLPTSTVRADDMRSPDGTAARAQVD
jgi:hypothetical protein